MNVGAITGDILLNEDPAVRALRTVETEARGMKRTVEDEFNQAGITGGKGFLKGLNDELGKKSVLGQFTKLAMGGGAVMGLAMAGRELNDFTKALGDDVKLLREGKMAAGEFWEKMAGGIPVLGQFWQAGRNIREMITGEAAAEDDLIASLKAETAVRERGLAIAREYRRETEALQAIQMELAGKVALKQDPSLSIAQNLEENLRRIDKATDPALLARVNAAGGPARAGGILDEQIEAAQKQVEFTRKMKAAIDAELGRGDNGDPRFKAWAKDNGIDTATDDALRKASQADAIRLANLDKEILDMKTLRQEADAYAAARDKAFDLRDQETRDLVAKGNPAAVKAMPAMMESVREVYRERLPNPVLQAEELFGPKTAGNTMPQYVDVEKDNTRAVERNNAALDKVGAGLDKLADRLPGGSGGAVASLDTLAGG